MGMIEEVAAHLVSSSTKFTAGQTLFGNAHPVVDEASCSLWESGGSAPVQAYGSTNLPAWEQPTLQIIARTSRPSSGSLLPFTSNARSMIHDAFVILNRVTNTVLSGTTYLRIEPRQSVMVLPGAEEDGRIVFSVNFDVSRRPTLAY